MEKSKEESKSGFSICCFNHLNIYTRNSAQNGKSEGKKEEKKEKTKEKETDKNEVQSEATFTAMEDKSPSLGSRTRTMKKGGGSETSKTNAELKAKYSKAKGNIVFIEKGDNLSFSRCVAVSKNRAIPSIHCRGSKAQREKAQEYHSKMTKDYPDLKLLSDEYDNSRITKFVESNKINAEVYQEIDGNIKTTFSTVRDSAYGEPIRVLYDAAAKHYMLISNLRGVLKSSGLKCPYCGQDFSSKSTSKFYDEHLKNCTNEENKEPVFTQKAISHFVSQYCKVFGEENYREIMIAYDTEAILLPNAVKELVHECCCVCMQLSIKQLTKEDGDLLIKAGMKKVGFDFPKLSNESLFEKSFVGKESTKQFVDFLLIIGDILKRILDESWKQVNENVEKKGIAGYKLLKLKKEHFTIPVYANNGSSYDSYHILKDLVYSGKSSDCLKKQSRIIHVRLHDLYSFIDSMLLSGPMSLETFAETFLVNEKIKKHPFPYEFLDSFEKLNSTIFPPKEAFHNRMKNEDIDDNTYGEFKREFDAKIKSGEWRMFMDYTLYYCMRDVEILTKTMLAYQEAMKKKN